MKKIINYQQKPKAEYSCQECQKNEAVIKLSGSAWLVKIKGNFCESCAINKIKYWYRKDNSK